jgi:spore coat polysaccharide biosynthesis protein SpsF
MKIVGVIQARDGSSRLPGKALMNINGMPMIEHVARRALAVRGLDTVIVSTSEDSRKIINWCHGKWSGGPRMPYYAGPETDLLARHLNAATQLKADAIVRLTADCPFHDPLEIELNIRNFMALDVDLYTNWGLGRALSEGLDCAIIRTDLMDSLSRNPECPREDWISWAIGRDGILQRHAPVIPYLGHNIHLSVDTPDDLERARRMMSILGNDNFAYNDTVHAWEATQ